MTGFAAMFGPTPRVTIPHQLTSVAALLQHLGCSQAELKKIRWFRRRMYRKFDIAKRGGKTRKILAPDRRLKMLQRQIADLLETIYRPRNPVHGFVRDRSVKTNAQCHLRSRHVLNLDIENFFPAITEGRVTGLLEAVGLDSQVADAIGWVCCHEGSLPQGAPSSPILSNMICFRLDK